MLYSSQKLRSVSPATSRLPDVLLAVAQAELEEAFLLKQQEQLLTKHWMRWRMGRSGRKKKRMSIDMAPNEDAQADIPPLPPRKPRQAPNLSTALPLRPPKRGSRSPSPSSPPNLGAAVRGRGRRGRLLTDESSSAEESDEDDDFGPRSLMSPVSKVHP